MPENWKTYKLGEVAKLSKKNISPKNFNNEVYIGLEHIGQGNFLLESTGTSNDVTSNKAVFKDGDILYGKIRPYFKKVYRPKFSGICSTDILVIISSDEHIVRQDYLYQLIKTQEFTDKATETSSGTKMPRADWNSLKKLNFQFPSLQEQKAIAAILSALDDKIELNLQMNKTLEEMAMALYKHWFVDFGPFQNGKFVESELGMIPEGWEIQKLINVTQELRRGISPNYTEGKGIEVVNQRCIRNHEVDFLLTRKHDINRKKIDGRLIEIGDVLVNSTGVGTLGRMAPVIQLKGDTVVDSHVTVVRVNTKNFLINNFARLMLHIEPIVESMGEGSTGQTELSRVALGELKVLVPPLNEQKHLEAHFQLFSESVVNNLNSIQTLTALRGTLLPKLISGEVRVKDIEHLVAAAL